MTKHKTGTREQWLAARLLIEDHVRGASQEALDWFRGLGPAGRAVAGARGDSVLQERERNGIPLPHGTWSRLRAAAEELGVTLPDPRDPTARVARNRRQ